MDNVAAFPGFSIPDNGRVESVIEILEEVLKRAKDGQVIAIALVTVERQPRGNVFEYVAEQSSRHSLMAGVLGLSFAMGREAYEGDSGRDST